MREKVNQGLSMDGKRKIADLDFDHAKLDWTIFAGKMGPIIRLGYGETGRTLDQIMKGVS